MRFVMVLIAGILIISTDRVLAEGFNNQSAPASEQTSGISASAPQMTTLQISPMILEIKVILEKFTLKEKALLSDLAGAEEEIEVQGIIAQIDGLDQDRDLEILHVQARYAQQAGRWALEKQIMKRILDLETGRMVAAR